MITLEPVAVLDRETFDETVPSAAEPVLVLFGDG